MNTKLAKWLFGCVIAIAWGFQFPHPVVAAEPVMIDLSDGRSVIGDVDVRTDDKRIWLRITEPGIVLFSGFEWKHIVRIHLGEKSLTVNEFKKQVAKLETDIPEGVLSLPILDRRTIATEVPLDGLPPLPGMKRLPGQPEFRSLPAPIPIEPRVSAIHIDAFLANWDDDVEPDGLRIVVTPTSVDGRIIPVDGTLDVRLFARALSLPGQRELLPLKQRRLFPELTRWGRRVRKTDFGKLGATYNLPFRSIHPEFDLDVGIDGLVNARLGISGQGVFHASDANVRIRSSSWYRDDHQLQTGKRHLREERTRPPKH